MTGIFDRHDSYAEHAHVASRLLFEAGPAHVVPEVSITIPTFRRPDLLMETVESVLAQEASLACEIVIVSNDEDEAQNHAIAARLPRNPRHALRFYANERNIGMFPNWNRGIELARGHWVSVLNDDDVLRPDFLTAMFRRIRANPRIDGLVCQNGFIDRRPGKKNTEAPRRSLPHAMWRAIVRQRYDRGGLAAIGPRQLFFGNELSSTLGFLLKRDLALNLGGFRAEDWPSADYLFYARFSAKHCLYLLNEVLADVGIGENESLRIEAMTGFMTQGDRLRQDMARAGHVPEGWLKMSPLIVSTAVAETNRFWHGQLVPEAIGSELGMTLPPPSRTKLNLLRLLHRAL